MEVDPSADAMDGYEQVLRRWLAPGILMIVAFAQIGLALTGELSPWKGGGFGMFAVVDSPDMRVMRVDGISQDGRRLRIDAADFMSEEGWDSLRAWPLRGQLEQFGRGLFELPMVAYGSRQSVALARLAKEDGRSGPGLDEQQGEGIWFRPSGASDPPELIPTYLASARLSWWRLEYDPIRHRVSVAQLGEPLSLESERDATP